MGEEAKTHSCYRNEINVVCKAPLNGVFGDIDVPIMTSYHAEMTLKRPLSWIHHLVFQFLSEMSKK